MEEGWKRGGRRDERRYGGMEEWREGWEEVNLPPLPYFHSPPLHIPPSCSSPILYGRLWGPIHRHKVSGVQERDTVFGEFSDSFWSGPAAAV